MVLVSDHNWPQNDAVDGLTHGAARLEYNARSWSAAMGTDGWITEDRPARLIPHFRKPYIDELIEAGLWKHFPGKGYQVQGYFPWNTPSARIAEIQEARRKAGAQGGRAKARHRQGRGHGGDRGPPGT